MAGRGGRGYPPDTDRFWSHSCKSRGRGHPDIKNIERFSRYPQWLEEKCYSNRYHPYNEGPPPRHHKEWERPHRDLSEWDHGTEGSLEKPPFRKYPPDRDHLYHSKFYRPLRGHQEFNQPPKGPWEFDRLSKRHLEFDQPPKRHPKFDKPPRGPPEFDWQPRRRLEFDQPPRSSPNFDRPPKGFPKCDRPPRGLDRPLREFDWPLRRPQEFDWPLSRPQDFDQPLTRPTEFDQPLGGPPDGFTRPLDLPLRKLSNHPIREKFDLPLKEHSDFDPSSNLYSTFTNDDVSFGKKFDEDTFEEDPVINEPTSQLPFEDNNVEEEAEDIPDVPTGEAKGSNLYCEICKLSFGDINQLQIHLVGAKHQKALNRRGLKNDAGEMTEIAESVTASLSQEKCLESGPKQLICRVCYKSCPADSLGPHIASDGHLIAEAEWKYRGKAIPKFKDMFYISEKWIQEEEVATESQPEEQDLSFLYCKICNVYSASYDQFQKHLQGRRHAKALKETSQPVYQCDICDINTSNQDLLDLHYKGREHAWNVLLKQKNENIIDPQFCCDICNINFCDKEELTLHFSLQEHINNIKKRAGTFTAANPIPSTAPLNMLTTTTTVQPMSVLYPQSYSWTQTQAQSICPQTPVQTMWSQPHTQTTYPWQPQSEIPSTYPWTLTQSQPQTNTNYPWTQTQATRSQPQPQTTYPWTQTQPQSQTNTNYPWTQTHITWAQSQSTPWIQPQPLLKQSQPQTTWTYPWSKTSTQ